MKTHCVATCIALRKTIPFPHHHLVRRTVGRMRRLINAALGADRAWLQLGSATRAFHNSPGIGLPPEEERARRQQSEMGWQSSPFGCMSHGNCAWSREPNRNPAPPPFGQYSADQFLATHRRHFAYDVFGILIRARFDRVASVRARLLIFSKNKNVCWIQATSALRME